VVRKLSYTYNSPELNKNLTWLFNQTTDSSHMMPFTNFVDMLNADFDSLESIPGERLDIHFKSYKNLCHICDVPYKYIVRLETLAEDYQFLMRMFGFWENFNDKHKKIGIIKENESTGLDYQQVLAGLTDEQVNKLAELKSEEMEMFGYTFDKSTLAFNYKD